MQISKTIYQPLGSPVTGVAKGQEIDLGKSTPFSPNTFVSIAHDGTCEVDRIASVSNGVVTVAGDYSGSVTVQALADLSGCWLQVDTVPLPPVSLGIICGSAAGMLLDRPVDECVAGRSLIVNGRDFGIIHGAAVIAGNRAILSVTNPSKIEGVAIAAAGQPQSLQGPRVNGSPFATINVSLPASGSMVLSLRQGWQSTKACIADVVTYSEVLCAGDLNAT